MKSYREVALQYKYGITNQDLCDHILLCIDTNDKVYNIKELCWLNNIGIPVFEYKIQTSRQLDALLIKEGKSCYIDYLLHIFIQWCNNLINVLKSNGKD